MIPSTRTARHPNDPHLIAKLFPCSNAEEIAECLALGENLPAFLAEANELTSGEAAEMIELLLSAAGLPGDFASAA